MSRLVLCASIFVSLQATLIQAESHSPQADPAPVDLFKAMEQNQLEVRIIPRDSTRATLIFHNKTDGPLHLRLPDAFAAAPVLAQQLAFPGFPQQQRQGQQSPQTVGGPMQQNNQLFPNALFNVPAGKTIKKRVPCVCLEFGKPDPKPQLKYQLTPIDTVVHSAKVMRLLEKLGDGETNQTHVQLAVWNAQNNITWDELAQLKHLRANGRKVPRYATTTLQHAKRLSKQSTDQKTNTVDRYSSNIPKP